MAAASASPDDDHHHHPADGSDDRLGSRRAAIKVFDRDSKGYISGSDLERVARSLGDNGCCDSCVREMIAAVEGGVVESSNLDVSSASSERVIRPKQMLKLVPPLCPAQELTQWDMLYKSGEVDPRA